MPRLLPLALLLGLAACHDDARPAPNLSGVQLGMSEADVTAIAGKPLSIERAACGPKSPTYFVYEGALGSSESYVLFIGDDVAQVVLDHRVLLTASEDVLAGCSNPAPPAG